MLQGKSKLFAAALLLALAGSVAGPDPALAAAPQRLAVMIRCQISVVHMMQALAPSLEADDGLRPDAA